MTVDHLVPISGETEGELRPETVLTSHGQTLVVTDNASGHSVRVTPASLYHYNCQQVTAKTGQLQLVQGIAALDADGLVLLDLPGEWHKLDLAIFAHRAGIPLLDARTYPPARVRAVLASRAPGWQRLRGVRPLFPRKWHKPLAICAGIAGMALMVYLAFLGMGAAWRAVSSIGRFLLEIFESKWLMVAFSPALLVLRPVFGQINRWKARRGTLLPSAGRGPYLKAKSSGKLQIFHGTELTATRQIGASPREAFSLLLYQYDSLTGLFILDITGSPLHHLPGRWLPKHAHTFTKRHNLSLAVHRISREEYLNLTRATKEATP
ncbi:hypothetical protein AB0392_29985 [Nonomuraea angiospora]|uniref:hypothetical protein n=1 Tax=Nonomuraea angiospora TaxID=46172 RepID=UPI00344C0153